MFITNYPAMLVGSWLVIADLHLGITRELYEKGISLRSQAKPLSERLNALKRMTKAKNLVVVGDFKHKIPGISVQELREVPEFIAALKFEKIVIVKGNHDGNIEKLVADKRVKVRKSFAAGDFIFTHGHRNVATKRSTIVIGHSHPHVKFVDDLGSTYIQPCWVIGRAGSHKVIIVPAFNELCGSAAVNTAGNFLGPVAKHIDRKNARVYLLDGTYLGRIKNLMVKGK